MDELTLRPFDEADREPVLALLADSLGWQVDDRHRSFFAWKHDENPFGASWAWVAEDPRVGVVGFRTFLRWRFDRPEGGTVEAVRAVDTATAPAHRGTGIFSRLTRLALDEVLGQSVGFVFNTPNDQSRPGYLKLGWDEIGRLPVELRPRSVGALPRILRSRVPADLWSEHCSAGLAAGEALSDDAALDALLRSQPRASALRTARSVTFLRWRYAGFPALGYRAIHRGATAADGIAVFRLRRRGRVLECALVEVLAPGGDRHVGGELARAALRASGADVALALAPSARWPGFVRTDRPGPVLTWRSVHERPPAPAIDRWALSLGDIELF